MLEYGVGVSTVRTIAIKRMNSDFFEESRALDSRSRHVFGRPLKGNAVEIFSSSNALPSLRCDYWALPSRKLKSAGVFCAVVATL